MGWSQTPLLAIGDVIQASQIDQVREGLIERRNAVGLGFAVPDKSPGSICQASTINTYRECIEILIPCYGRFSGENWTAWTKATCLTAALGHSNWMNKPARDPQGVSYGDTLTAGTVMYIEHLNEMQAVINQLRWIRKELDSYGDRNGVGGLHKLPEVLGESKQECILAFQLDIENQPPMAEGVSDYSGISLSTYQEGQEPDITYSLYTVPYDLNRGFMEVATPDVSGGFATVKVSAEFISRLNESDPWPQWTAAIYYSTTDPDPLDENDWDFGTLLASTVVTQSGAALMNGVTTPPGNTIHYLQMRGKEGNFSCLEDQDWTDRSARQANWGTGGVYMYFECNFHYH